VSALQAWFHCRKDRRGIFYIERKKEKGKSSEKNYRIFVFAAEQEKLTKRDFPSGSFFSG
jgi:hypothetical protein